MSIFDQERIYEYDYRNLHEDIENGHFTGFYGGDNCCWLALAEQRHNKENANQPPLDMLNKQGVRTQDEVYVAELKELLDDPRTQKYWKRIVTFDPFGMESRYPSIAATPALLNIPELDGLTRDGIIVDEFGAVRTIKAAVQYAWNIPSLSERLNFSPDELRSCLFKYTQHPSLAPDAVNGPANVFFPSVGGMTVYVFGDPRKIRDPATKITVRVHDECCGSDVFGTDICTCRPYLMFAMRAAVETAQKGGVGIVTYFKKEGRALGEVTKYRVYNARKNQDGGDTAAKYFFQTESIAGVRDARFQTMMPDVLHWLGITRIDYLLSMSNEKFSAIRLGEIQVIQRIPLPDHLVPRHADVEITAKIASGYHTEDMKSEDVIATFRELRTIRRQCSRLHQIGLDGNLLHWFVNMNRMEACVDYVLDVIRDRFGDENGKIDVTNIPPHSRFRHLDPRKVAALFDQWKDVADAREACRRVIDMIVISVLVDAGAGAGWKYVDAEHVVHTRSEGLAQAALDMFLDGLFSSDPAVPNRVNSLKLKTLTKKQLDIGFQIHENNEMVGLPGRCALLNRLGSAMESHPEYFGKEVFRPGHLLDYILNHEEFDRENRTISVHVLWHALIVGLEPIWPNRLSGVRRGDVWTHELLKEIGQPGSDFVPFHKLTQWLAYSLLEAFSFANITFLHVGDMTVLAEYRNGGLLSDLEVITPKDPAVTERSLDVGSQIVVEFRALTITLIDEVAKEIRRRLGLAPDDTTAMPLAKILEGGTWAAGRKIAYDKRGGASPIKLDSDGTVF